MVFYLIFFSNSVRWKRPTIDSDLIYVYVIFFVCNNKYNIYIKCKHLWIKCHKIKLFTEASIICIFTRQEYKFCKHLYLHLQINNLYGKENTCRQVYIGIFLNSIQYNINFIKLQTYVVRDTLKFIFWKVHFTLDIIIFLIRCHTVSYNMHCIYTKKMYLVRTVIFCFSIKFVLFFGFIFILNCFASGLLFYISAKQF